MVSKGQKRGLNRLNTYASTQYDCFPAFWICIFPLFSSFFPICIPLIHKYILIFPQYPTSLYSQSERLSSILNGSSASYNFTREKPHLELLHANEYDVRLRFTFMRNKRLTYIETSFFFLPICS